MRTSKKIIALLLAGSMLAMLAACGSTAQTQTASAGTDTTQTPAEDHGGGGVIDKSTDTQLQTILSEVESKFKQVNYTDAATGKTFAYNLFVPENYDTSQKYPLVLFIADASVVGQSTTRALEQGYGAVVWADAAEQAKNPCFILAPVYPENILKGDTDITDYVPATVNLLKSLQSTYSIDADRLYMTGQSMGCMTGLYLNAKYPELFAASLYVDGQWDTNILSPLEQQKFFYFAAAGDQKASAGMSNVKKMFDSDSVAYSQTTLNAKDSAEAINAAVSSLIAQGKQNNFVSWTEGSVLPEGVTSEGANEHMYSFDHAYQIPAVRDWLFAQSK